MTALGEGLRPPDPYRVRGVPVGPPTTPPARPARRFCPNNDQPRWLWWGYHCSQEHELQRRYGIGCDDYWRMFQAQSGRCGICRRQPAKGRRLVVDHDHDTGAIDGLCHFGCNRALSTSLRRYLADPPGRRFGLAVAPAKLTRIQERDEATRQRAKERAERRKATKIRAGAPSLLPRLKAMTERGADRGER